MIENRPVLVYVCRKSLIHYTPTRSVLHCSTLFWIRNDARNIWVIRRCSVFLLHTFRNVVTCKPLWTGNLQNMSFSVIHSCRFSFSNIILKRTRLAYIALLF